MRVVALGRTRMLLEGIRQLRAAGHQIILIGTCQESPEYGVGTKDFEQLAREIGADFFEDHRVNSPAILDRLKRAEADVAVSVNWLTLMKEDVLGLFPKGVLNAHAGDLPRYRGNACPNWAILQGEKRIAVSIHLMTPDGVDAGPIVLKRHLELSRNTTIGQIYEFLESAVPTLFVQALEKIGQPGFLPEKQPTEPGLALRCYPRIPSDSCIDWRQSAEMVSRLIRASSAPFAGAYTILEKDRLIVWAAHPGDYAQPSLSVPGQVLGRDPRTGEVEVATGEGVLVLTQVQREGQVKMPAAEVICSTRTRLGLPVEDELLQLQRRVQALEERFGPKTE